MNKFNVKEKFLELTEYNIPYGTETFLEDKLPKNIKKDSFGNYYLRIGKSKSLFTAHLDDASWGFGEELDKVNHVIEDEIIRTDGTTILGADDKSGVVVLLYMISYNIPGTYYFFIGEESGMIGSEGILSRNVEWFEKNFKRCISFDRRGYGSIISRQMGKDSCSDEFVDKLSDEFDKNGMYYRNDPSGIFTDSAAFIDIIPECTNLSVGYFNEHSNFEHQNIKYLEQLCEVCLRVNWENLN